MGELRRRLVHASGSGVPVAYLLDSSLELGLFTWPVVQGFLVACTVGAVVLEALRLTGRVDWWVFDELTREYERDHVAAYAWYLVGMTTVALAATATVAVPAMLMLTVGDPVSGYLGSGELRDVKQLWVLLVMFAVCVFIAAWFVPPVVALLGAVTATVADGVKPVVAGYVVDDNLTIPIGAATVMTLALAV